MRKFVVGIAILALIGILLSGGFTLRNPQTGYTYNYEKYFRKQHFLKQIGMPPKLTLLKEGVMVAVIDIGMDLNHPAYKSKLLKSDFKGEDAIYPKDEAALAHGTAVASIIAAESNEMLGIAPNVKILPVLIGLPYPKGYEDIATTYYKMKPKDILNLSKEPEKLKRFKEFGKVRAEIILKNTANAIKYAVDHGAKIICMSATTVNETRYIEDAVKYAHSKGVVVVAPTGNNAKSIIYYPAKFDEVIAVGGVNEHDEWWYEEKELKGFPVPIKQGSNFGEGIDVVAPCCNILHAYPTGLSETIYQSGGCGTSLAAPQVAGLAALIMSKNPNLTSDEVKEIIIKGCDDLGPQGWDEKYGYGRINIGKTLKLVTK
jgi:subtilisin family serine protease